MPSKFLKDLLADIPEENKRNVRDRLAQVAEPGREVKVVPFDDGFGLDYVNGNGWYIMNQFESRERVEEFCQANGFIISE